MPMKVTAVAAAGELHPNPFLGPVNHVVAIRTDVSDFSTNEVDLLGWLKPGVLLTRAGQLVEPDQTLLAIGTLLLSAADAIKFKTTTTSQYKIGDLSYSDSAADNIVFTAAHVVTALKYGAILVQVNAAGDVTTLIGEATQTTAMAYATAALAIAALPEPADLKVMLGYILINADAGDWTANTDDMTDGSDLTTAVFVDGAVGAASAASNIAFGAVVEAVKVATTNTGAALAAAADIDITVATICMMNRAILEDSLGRVLTTSELYNKPDSIVLAY